MAQQQQQQMAEDEEQRLKYLGFVQNAAVGAAGCVVKAYGFAKDRTGPLKNGVESVEGKVKDVVAPVYVKYHGAPAQLLTFVDRKVDESVTKATKMDPRPVIKQASCQAFSAAQKVPESACAAVKSVYSKYEKVPESACVAAKSVYAKYEPKAEECAANVWRKLNNLPVFPKVAEVVVPAAAYFSDKYNETVQQTTEKGYKVASYLPLVPTERIAKVFGEKVPEMEPLSPGESNVAIH